MTMFDKSKLIDIVNDKKIKIVAFDFFDTIVHRDCSPEVVLFEWAKQCSYTYDFNVSPTAFYKLRKRKEKEGKSFFKKEEITYRELMELVYENLNLNTTFDSFFECALKTELEIELSHSILDDDIVEILPKLKMLLKKMVVVSDFYVGKVLLCELLKKHGLERFFDDIYVSSDFGVRKSTGNLYKIVKERNGCAFSEILMVGDNIISDVNIPNKLGIITCFKKYVDLNVTILSDRKFIAKSYDIICKNINVGIFNWYVPEIVYFVSKLHVHCVKNNIVDLFFCSREGQLMKILFDLYQEYYFNKDCIKTHYLFVSRKSTLVASLDRIEDENFELFLRQYNNITVKNFLLSISFNTDEINNILKLNALSENDIVTNNKNDRVIKILKNSLEFKKIYDAKRLISKNILIKYVDGFERKDNSSGVIVIVDIGWKGTIQDCLIKILNDKYDVRGIYWGLLGKNYGMSNIEKKQALMFRDLPEQSYKFSLFSKNYMILEDIFVADHGPVIGYKYDYTNNIIPLLQNNEEQLQLYKNLQVTQEELKCCFISMLGLYNNFLRLPYEDVENVWKLSLINKCMMYPKMVLEYSDLSKYRKENFGETTSTKTEPKFIFKKHHFKNVNYGFVDYVYRILKKFNLKFLFPIAKGYCFLVLCLKYIWFKLEGKSEINKS